MYRCGQGGWQGIPVYRCIANLKGKVCRNADPRGKYADTPIRARRMARCIGVSVRAGRVAGYVGVSVYRRCEGKSTPTRPSTRQIRRYADPGRNYADTPIRRYADPGREGISVYRCGAVYATRSAGSLRHLQLRSLPQVTEADDEVKNLGKLGRIVLSVGLHTPNCVID